MDKTRAFVAYPSQSEDLNSGVGNPVPWVLRTIAHPDVRVQNRVTLVGRKDFDGV
jgi:hypothetical protein